MLFPYLMWYSLAAAVVDHLVRLDLLVVALVVCKPEAHRYLEVLTQLQLVAEAEAAQVEAVEERAVLLLSTV